MELNNKKENTIEQLKKHINDQKQKKDDESSVDDELIRSIEEVLEENCPKQPNYEQSDKKQQVTNSDQDKIEDLTHTIQRLQAEFDNFRKRSDKEKADLFGIASAGFIKSLLPFIDTLEIALKNTADHEKFVKGIQLVQTQLNSILQKEGVRPIEALGKKLNPDLHDVLLKEKSDKPEDTIIDELQKGYYFKDKILRHSKVKISSNETD